MVTLKCGRQVERYATFTVLIVQLWHQQACLLCSCKVHRLDELLSYQLPHLLYLSGVFGACLAYRCAPVGLLSQPNA